MAKLVQKEIVIAEDSYTIGNMLRVLLSDNPNFLVKVVLNGEEALLECKSFPPDLLITANTMEGLNGLELISKIKESCPKTKILFMTAGGKHAIKDGLNTGADACIDKPFPSMEAIVQAVSDLIGS